MWSSQLLFIQDCSQVYVFYGDTNYLIHWSLVFLVSMSLPIWKLKVDGDNNIRFGQENHSALEVYKINK